MNTFINKKRTISHYGFAGIAMALGLVVTGTMAVYFGTLLTRSFQRATSRNSMQARLLMTAHSVAALMKQELQNNFQGFQSGGAWDDCEKTQLTPSRFVEVLNNPSTGWRPVKCRIVPFHFSYFRLPTDNSNVVSADVPLNQLLSTELAVSKAIPFPPAFDLKVKILRFIIEPARTLLVGEISVNNTGNGAFVEARKLPLVIDVVRTLAPPLLANSKICRTEPGAICNLVAAVPPAAPSLDLSDYFKTEVDRLIAVSDEVFATVTNGLANLQCQLNGSAWASCTVSNGVLSLSTYNSGGTFCVRTSSDAQTWSEKGCIELRAFTPVTCNATITAAQSPVGFNFLESIVAANKVTCFEDGAVVENPNNSTDNQIDILEPERTLIARTGAYAIVRSLRVSTTSLSNNTIFALNWQSTDSSIVGLNLFAYGSDGNAIANWGADRFSMISNTVHTWGWRGKGILANGSYNRVWGNTITTEDWYGRPIEMSTDGWNGTRYGNIIKYNILLANGGNQTHGIIVWDNFRDVIIENNVVTFNTNSWQHGLRIEGGSSAASIKNNTFKLMTNFGGGSAIGLDGSSSASNVSGNTTCTTTASNYWTPNTINDGSGTLWPQFVLPLQVQIGGPCP